MPHKLNVQRINELYGSLDRFHECVSCSLAALAATVDVDFESEEIDEEYRTAVQNHVMVLSSLLDTQIDSVPNLQAVSLTRRDDE